MEKRMIVLNFAHPLTATQRAEIERLSGQTITTTLEQPLQIDEQQGLEAQIRALIDKLGFSTEEWQQRILINVPGYAPAAVCLLAEVHGRMGHFPTVVCIRRQAGSTPTVYEVGEMLNLEAVRNESRKHRSSSPA